MSLRAVQECLSAEYGEFAVASEREFYRLTANNFISSSSTMGNSGVGPMLSSFLSKPNGMKFTTKDSDNDRQGDVQIVQQSISGGWWYDACFQTNLNGQFRASDTQIGINSKTLRNGDKHFQFLFSEMKLKPHAVTADLSTVANCSRTVCAGRCFHRDHNFGVWCFPAKQRTWHVSPTGSDVLNDGIFAPLATIQLAVHYASDGDTILLAPGTYKGGSDCTTFEGEFHGASKRRCNYNIDYMGKKITIDGRGRATIDCEAFSFGLMPKRGFIMANGETHQSVLQGVKITHCRGGKGGENKRNMYGLHVGVRWRHPR